MRKVKLCHKKGGQRKMSYKESMQIKRMGTKPQPNLKHVTKIGNRCVRYINKTLCETEKAFFINYVKYEIGNSNKIYTKTDMHMWTDMWGEGGGRGSAHVVRYADWCICVCVCACACVCMYVCGCVAKMK